MELLYVVELEVQPSKDSALDIGEARLRVLDHIREWLHHDRRDQLSAEAFEAAGEAVMADDGGERPDQRVSWSVDGTPDCEALLVTVRSGISSKAHADFVCTITLLTESDRLIVRLELGREAVDGVLAPASISFFRRPFLLIMLLRDSDLQCWTGSSRVDGRFNWVNPVHVDLVWESITDEERLLPILLIDAAEEAASDLAWKCAGELAGLAVVLAVDDRAGQILDERLREIDASVPTGGLRLIWPDLDLRHPSFGANQAPLAPGRLLRMLSSVSVTVRGANDLARRASAARRAARNRAVAEELEAARAAGDIASELEAQAQALASYKQEAELYEHWIQELERDRDAYKAQAAQAVYWKQEAERARQGGGVRQIEWSEAPELDESDLADLAKFLEKQAQGALVFTIAAHRSWKKDKYAHVEVMRDALVLLTQAAIEYRRLGCQLGMVPDDWFKEEWELTMASTDRYMSKHNMDSFEYDSHTYSRLPHLKLGDYTAPNEVGRVYFAMDSDGERFIVDHVGLKLYGL